MTGEIIVKHLAGNIGKNRERRGFIVVDLRERQPGNAPAADRRIDATSKHRGLWCYITSKSQLAVRVVGKIFCSLRPAVNTMALSRYLARIFHESEAFIGKALKGAAIH